MKKQTPATAILALVVLSIATISCNFFKPFDQSRKDGPASVLPASPSKLDESTDREKLVAEIVARFKRKDFESIEKLASEARMSKERLRGGYWKLGAIYGGLEEPNPKQKSTEAEWQEHLDRLTVWQNQMPNSVTARVAKAESLTSWAWEARGSGFIDTVSESSLELFQERIQMAVDELATARKLDTKCPEWYAAALEVGLAQGWPKKEYERVFEEGFALEPTYYPIQRAKLTYLYPQWHGKKGDQAKFIEENSARIEGEEGRAMYFLLTSTLLSQYRGDLFREVEVSWEKVKQGYQMVAKNYKTDRYRENQITYLAIFSMDFEMAASKMLEIGDNWDKEVWQTRENFERLKQSMEQYKSIRSSNPNANTQNSQ